MKFNSYMNMLNVQSSLEEFFIGFENELDDYEDKVLSFSTFFNLEDDE